MPLVRRSVLLALAAGAGVLATVAVAQNPEVDLELILAVDVSRSIDDEEYRLQREGYAQAFMHPSVIGAIQSNPKKQIAVAFTEWAGTEFQRVVVPWTVISDAESGALFSEAILRATRSFYGWTSISGAIDHSLRVFQQSPYKSARRVIDISGDGINNSGRSSDEARDEALAAGVTTINGLVITNDRPVPGPFQIVQPPLDDFFRQHVIGGAGAFVIAIEDFQSFAYAIINKLIREIAAEPAPTNFAAAE